MAEGFDPDVEDTYWRDHYASRPYVRPGSSSDDYRSAYLYGGSRRASLNTTWDEAEHDLERGWDTAKDKSRLAWNDARNAVRDGWHRVERALPGDADGDGR